jgi:hypothetical protein
MVPGKLERRPKNGRKSTLASEAPLAKTKQVETLSTQEVGSATAGEISVSPFIGEQVIRSTHLCRQARENQLCEPQGGKSIQRSDRRTQLG